MTTLSSCNSRFAKAVPWVAVVGFLFVAKGGESPHSKEQGRQLHVKERRAADGRLWETQTYYLDDAGEKVWHGPTISWFRNGKQHVKVEYREGKMHGLLTEWTQYGEKIREEHWANGKREGLSTTWDFHGKKTSQCTYKGGWIVGKKTYWEEDKIIREEVYDKKGRQIELTAWYLNGQKRIHGTFKAFRLTLEELRGDLVKPIPHDVAKELEKLAAKGVYDSKKHGVWTYWERDGRVVARGEWKEGKPWEGVCGVPVAGSSGLENFGHYRNGKMVEKVPHPFHRRHKKMPQ